MIYHSSFWSGQIFPVNSSLLRKRAVLENQLTVNGGLPLVKQLHSLGVSKTPFLIYLLLEQFEVFYSYSKAGGPTFLARWPGRGGGSRLRYKLCSREEIIIFANLSPTSRSPREPLSSGASAWGCEPRSGRWPRCQLKTELTHHHAAFSVDFKAFRRLE